MSNYISPYCSGTGIMLVTLPITAYFSITRVMKGPHGWKVVFVPQITSEMIRQFTANFKRFRYSYCFVTKCIRRFLTYTPKREWNTEFEWSLVLECVKRLQLIILQTSHTIDMWERNPLKQLMKRASNCGVQDICMWDQILATKDLLIYL